MSNIDKIKSTSKFLNHDCNDDCNYKLNKTGKRVLNLPQNQLYNTKHHYCKIFFNSKKYLFIKSIWIKFLYRF